jgi:hypothetical protein
VDNTELTLTLNDRAIDAIADCIAFLRRRAREARQQHTTIKVGNPVSEEPAPTAVSATALKEATTEEIAHNER